MAQGMNEAYRRDPSTFLSNHEINRNPMAFRVDPIRSPGPSNIDLVPVSRAARVAGPVRIENYDHRQHRRSARAIRAYWLPAKRNEISTITLGNLAKYFFTADLTGCLFAAYFDNNGDLTVEHTNYHGIGAYVRNNMMLRLTFIQGMLANGPIKVLTPIPWPAALGPVPVGQSGVVYYPSYAWVIGGRLAGGWRFRYKVNESPNITHVL